MKTIYPQPFRHFVSTYAAVGQGRKLLLALLAAALSFFASPQSGGIFEGYVFLTVNGSFNTYHLQTNTGGTVFNGANLGTFCSARNSIVFSGGENKTFKCGSCDITGGNIFYRVYPQGSSTPPAFTSLSLPFAANIAGAGGGCQNQQWRTSGGSQNVLAGLGNGTYVLEVFTNAPNAGCNGGTFFYSNLGQNYRATFSVNNNPNSGLFESYAVLNIKGAGNSFYDLNASTSLPDLQGANLGSFFTNETLVIAGGENKTFKCGLDNVTASRLRYRVYPAGSPAGAFLAVNLPFASNDAGAGQGCQNQTWRSTTGSANVIAGLQPGNYTLEVYSESDYTSCVDGTHFANRGGANYRANFTVQGLPVNCVLSDWGEWSPWSTDACGETATRTRQRSVITPAANGGAECGPLTETE
ncbi:MAG: thrombospondin type-1 domain-containing protein, partial [Chitinophagaceae bacterium]|nr:thrombospondin type-1 domain-containing protein [Chitinophagaceae bacterium]